MNNKLKKLLVATLATTSTFSGFNAFATDFVTTASPSTVNVGAQPVAIRNAAAAPAGASPTAGDTLFIGANNATVNFAAGANTNVDLYGFRGVKLGFSDQAGVSATTVVNTVGVNAARVTATNDGADIAAGDSDAVSFVHVYNAVFNDLVLTQAQIDQRSSIDFNNKAATYTIATDGLQFANTFVSTGGNNGTIVVNAKGVVFKDVIGNGAGTNLNQLTINDDKSATLSADATFANGVTVGSGANGGAFTVSAGTLTADLDPHTADTSTLILSGGNITGNIGGARAFKDILFTGAAGTLTGTVNANTINLSGAGTLVANGVVTSANGLAFNVAGAAFQYGANQDLLSVTFGEGVNGSQVTQNIGANTTATATANITTAVAFTGANSILAINADRQALQPVTTSANNQGTINYAGAANITANIGTQANRLAAVNLNDAGEHIVNAGVAVWAPINIKVASTTVNIGSNATVYSIVPNGALANVNIVANSPVTFGAVDFLGVGDNSQANFNGGTVIDNTNTVNFNSGAYTVDNGGAQITFTSATAQAGARFVAANNTPMSFTGANTKLNGASLAPVLAAGRLVLNANISANNPVINVDYSSAALPNSYAAMVEANANPVVTAGAITATTQAMADTLRLKGNRLAQYTAQFNNGTNVTDVITGYTLADFDQHFSVGDKTADWGAEAYSVVNAYANASDVSDLDKLVAPSHTVDSSRATSNSAVDVATRALDSFGSDVAISAGESANNVGMFVTPFMASGKTKSDGNIAGNSFRMNGASVGMTVDLNDDSTRLGFALTFANSKAKMKDAKSGDSSKGQTTAVTAFGEYEFANNLTFQGIATLGSVSTKAKETFTLGQYSGKYQSTFYSLLGKVGYNISVNPEMSMMPYTTVRYDSYRDPAYSLSLNGNKVKYSSSNTNKTAAMVGVKFSGDMKYDETKLAPFADLSFGCDFGKANFKTIDLGNLTPNSQNSDNNRTLMSARLGVEATMESGFSATLAGGSDRIGKKTTVYSGSLKLAYKF